MTEKIPVKKTFLFGRRKKSNQPVGPVSYQLILKTEEFSPKQSGRFEKCPGLPVDSKRVAGKRLFWGQMKLLIENNLLNHNKTMKSQVKNKRGTLGRVPSSFRGMVRGKRFMIVGGLFPAFTLLFKKSFHLSLCFKYHTFSEMSNKIY